MLGLADWGIAMAYLASVIGAAGCVLYGVVNWNSSK